MNFLNKWNVRTKKGFYLYVSIVLLICFVTVRVHAEDDPLSVVNNFSDFIFSLI